MTLWELAGYFAVFLGGSAGGWITCAVFTAARVNELGAWCEQLERHLRNVRALRVRVRDDRDEVTLLDCTVGDLEARAELFGVKD